MATFPSDNNARSWQELFLGQVNRFTELKEDALTQIRSLQAAHQAIGKHSSLFSLQVLAFEGPQNLLQSLQSSPDSPLIYNCANHAI